MMRTLLVAPTTPFDATFGAAQRTRLLYQALQEHAHVDVMILTEGSKFSVGPAERPGEVARLTFRTPPPYARYMADAQVCDWIQRELGERRYDLVVGRELSAGTKLAPAVGGRVIIDADDACYRYAPGGDSQHARFVSQAKSAARMMFTRHALPRFAHVWFASSRDRARFTVRSGSVLPNIAPEAQSQPPPNEQDPVVLFVGAMWYAPNRYAVDWFIQHCWTAIRAAFPAARFRIVGACPLAQRAAWQQHQGVESPGFVADLAAEYRAARFTIAPVRFGGGTQIKTLESFAYGRAAVVSSFVSDGFDDSMVPGESILVADSPVQMIDACKALLGNPQRATRIARAGQQAVRERFNWSIFRRAVGEGIEAARR
jgi:glycosyltransferase involved in cell wall biosynthesis